MAVIVLLFQVTSGWAQVPDTAVVWPEMKGGGQNIYYQEKVNGKWNDKIILSSDNPTNFTPSIAATSDGSVLVVWTVFEGRDAYLEYRARDSGNWSTIKRFNTGMSSNTAPSLLIDEAEEVWLAWSGYDGTDDEIFVSNWQRQTRSWSPPQQINPPNEWPDAIPELLEDPHNNVVVQWLGFDGIQYENFSQIIARPNSQTPVARPSVRRKTQQKINRLTSARVGQVDLPAGIPRDIPRGGVIMRGSGRTRSMVLQRKQGRLITQ